jgi:hypothetical protein
MNRKGGEMYFKSQNLKAKSKKSKLFLVLLPFTFYLFTLFGCATIKEDTKKILGVSTKVLEEGRKEAVKKQFNYDYNTCYNKVKAILKENGSYIYAQGLKKHMLAVYVSEQDTTPVGIFFKEIGTANTQIEVSSPSTYAKELISTKVFSELEKALHPQQKEGQTDEKK